MNLPKAKEIIDLNIKEAGKKMPPDVKQALQLGSEAIYAWQQFRDGRWLSGRYDLPSETIE